MFPNLMQVKFSGKSRAKGSALVIAIFVIVVMSLLGAGLSRMLSSSAQSIAYEVIGTRAFLKAQSGLQWGLQQRFPLLPNVPTHCNTNDVVSSGSSAEIEIDLVILPSLANNDAQGCKVEKLTCSDFKVDGVVYYTITSTAQCTVAEVETTRTLEVSARTL